MSIIKLTSPAKVNLCLNITGKNNDDYHELSSLVVFCDINDYITIEPSNEFILNINGQFAHRLKDLKENLITKSVFLLAKTTNNKPHLKITLTKNLPIASGLGGGSSNAAIVLNFLNLFWEINDGKLIRDIGKAIGADVISCINAENSIIEGIGEKSIKTIHFKEQYYILLSNPMIELPTKEVFKKFDRDFSNKLNFNEDINFLSWLSNQKNDLYTTANRIFPEISQLINLIDAQIGCEYSNMSGSGATCFGIFKSEDDAKKAQKSIQTEKPKFWTEIGKIN